MIKRDWKEIPRDGRKAQWAGIYVTLNSKGTIVLNRSAHQQTGSPAAYLIMYDAANHSIGLKPTGTQIKNAYPVAKSGRHGGQKLAAYRLLVECGLHIDDTLEFPDAEIDTDEILILNLRTAKISNRALNHPKRRVKSGE